MKKAEVVIEKTSKSLKEKELFLTAFAVGGVVVGALGYEYGYAVSIVAVIGFIGIKLMEWWRHG